MTRRPTKWLKFIVPGCVVLQLSACFGSDPEFFFASTVANAVVFNIVSALFDLVVAGLTATTAILLG
jgi:hypothetical protein